jgi:hypothetical protein
VVKAAWKDAGRLAVNAALIDLCDLHGKSHWRAWDAVSRYTDLGTPRITALGQ